MLIWQGDYATGTNKGVPDGTVLNQHANGQFPVESRPWVKCNYLLIPCPGNTWYLFLVNISEWKFRIYDCIHNEHTPDQVKADQVKAHANATLTMVNSLLLDKVVAVRRDIRKYRNKNLKQEIIEYLSCANNR